MYGVTISLGILISALVAEKIAKKEGKNTDILWGGLLWAILFGVAGARLYHVIDYWNLYGSNPLLIVQVWNGGLGIFGAILGGGLSIFAYLRWKKSNPVFWVDLAALVMPLGQAIGRWGNFFNQELFGPPTSLPWGIYINSENRPSQFLSSERFHPLFLYESLLSLALFLFLYRLYVGSKAKIGSGFYIYAYLAGYSIIRFLLEFFRIRSWTLGGIQVAQGISAIIVLFTIPKVITMLKSKHDIPSKRPRRL